jgi:hypothetical protein
MARRMTAAELRREAANPGLAADHGFSLLGCIGEQEVEASRVALENADASALLIAAAPALPAAPSASSTTRTPMVIFGDQRPHLMNDPRTAGSDG